MKASILAPIGFIFVLIFITIFALEPLRKNKRYDASKEN